MGLIQLLHILQKVANQVKWVFWILLLVLVQLVQFYPECISHYYSQGLFRWMTLGMRQLVAKVPYSLGEWVYILLIILLIVNLIRYFIDIKNKFAEGGLWKQIFLPILFKFIQVYVVFQMIWGLNYHQSSPAQQFGLQVKPTYSEQELNRYSLALIEQMNQSRANIQDSQFKKRPDSLTLVIEKVKLAYAQVARVYPFLHYPAPNIKLSPFPNWGDRLGYLAFYQPITSEAIIRADLPILLQPYTVAHEIAHQLGYASETEANFIAYLVCGLSKEAILKYAMQLQMFTYCQEEALLMIAKRGDFKQWKNIVSRNKAALSPQVLKDRLEIKQFFRAHQGKMIPGSTALYDQFLQWNKQARGIDSYNDVLLWAMAYEKKKNNP
jgi:hypothetical protein